MNPTCPKCGHANAILEGVCRDCKHRAPDLKNEVEYRCHNCDRQFLLGTALKALERKPDTFFDNAVVEANGLLYGPYSAADAESVAKELSGRVRWLEYVKASKQE